MSAARWGLLSTAKINEKLIPAIQASARGDLVAVASRSLEKAQAYATQWDIQHAFGDYQSMLDSGEVDAVYIGLPNHLHAEWSIRAMKAGVHVLCEKPFAPTLGEVDRVIKTSQETGKVVTEAFMYRHHPQTELAGEWVRSGRLGDISLFRGVFNFAMESRENIRLVPDYGGGCLWDVGVYPMSLAQYLFGAPPLSVFGMQWIGDTGVDETFVGQMKYSGDRLAQITSSFRTPFYTFAEVIGTEGRLTINRPFINMDDGGLVMFYPKRGVPQEITVESKNLYLGEVEDMHTAILDGAKPYLSLKETRDHIQTVLALYKSANLGKMVELG